MTPEARHLHNIEHEDPTVARFMKAIAAATEGGKTIGDQKYKLHAVGDLLIATVHRIYSPLHSLYVQDKGSGRSSVISGIEFDKELDTLGRNVPQVIIDLNPNKVPLEDRIRRDLEEDVLAARESDLRNENETSIEQKEPTKEKEVDFLSKLLGIIDVPPLQDDFVEKFRERVGFLDRMRTEGLYDVKPANLEKVVQGLEIIVFSGRWGKKKREARAETLFREGLGLTE